VATAARDRDRDHDDCHRGDDDAADHANPPLSPLSLLAGLLLGEPARSRLFTLSLSRGHLLF
jgi:hypothetical protein